MKTKRIKRETPIDPDAPINQENFGAAIGISQSEVSRLKRYGVLPPDGTFREWNVAYSRFLMGQIFAKRGWQGVVETLGI